MTEQVIDPGGFLAGGGEMGRLMRELDWSRTPIGPVEGWPASLRTAVSICLSSRFPILLWWGPELAMLYNDPYRPMLGASKHPRALGCPGAEIWPEIWDVIGPMLYGVMASGEATWSEDQLLLLDRNGYLEECYFTFSYSPIRDQSGDVHGIFTAVTETTERVLGDRRLRTVAALAARTSDVHSVAEVGARAVEALGTDPADLPFAQLYLDDGDGLRLAATMGDTAPGDWALDGDTEHVVASHGRTAVVLPFRRPGATGVLVAGVTPRRALDDDYREFFRLLADQIASAVASAQGLEDERRRAEALAELDRAKTEFFSNVSHEFRTPLTLMVGPLADALADQSAPLPAPQRERVETARRSALRLLRLVNALLDFSRIEAGRAEAALEPVDLGEIVADAASGFRPLVEGAGVALRVECPEEPVVVSADPAMAENIVLNLLSNAYKFTLDGEIRVALTTRGDRAVLTVADTGAGIPQEELPRLFERFHRVRGAEARSHEGTGIGLALVRELAHLQGGGVEVASRVGEGTAFTLELPLAAPGSRAVQRPPSDEAAGGIAEAARWGARAEDGPAEERDARVLVADDNADMRDYLARLLGEHWNVETAADGVQALECARRGGLHLVVADVMMPRLDGFGLLRELRADPATRRLPVIMVSARAGVESAVEGLDAGADDYLVKPFSAMELVARVRGNLELARLREEVAASERERAEQVAETLQRSLLPERLPEVIELELAGRYVPAAGDLRVGGDWYDAVPLGDGRIVLAIGDVAGHGIRAAAIMGQVRHALRAYTREGHAPAELIHRLDELVLLGGLDMVTCLCALLDPATGELRWASAGHLPPLVVGSDGAHLLEGPVGHPLGVLPGSRHTEGAVTLADGEALVLYTDGLVERRDAPIDAGLDRLAAALRPDAPGALCEAALGALLDGGRPADDVALLVARRVRLTGAEARLSIAAEPIALREVRCWLRAWLRGNELTGRRADDLVLAVHEAGMNAVEHAYGSHAGRVELTARRDGTRVDVVIADTGTWRERTRLAGDRGRGERLMRALVDDVEVERGESGSRVRLRTELGA